MEVHSVLFWKLFLYSFSIIIAANIVGQIIIAVITRRHRTAAGKIAEPNKKGISCKE
jgi:hypothetical protein